MCFNNFLRFVRTKYKFVQISEGIEIQIILSQVLFGASLKHLSDCWFPKSYKQETKTSKAPISKIKKMEYINEMEEPFKRNKFQLKET